MQFVFKRDGEGRERIYVGDVCVVYMIDEAHSWGFHEATKGILITSRQVDDAIERADEAGFWAPVEHIDRRYNRLIRGSTEHGIWVAEVTVDVPVADNAVMSVTVEGDES